MNESIANVTTQKIVIGTGFGALLTYLGMNHEAVIILTAFIVADVMTGITASWVVDPASVKSKIGIRGLISKTIIFMLPFAAAAWMKAGGYETQSGAFVSTILSLLITYEFYSILGNIYSIRAKKKITESDAILSVIDRIRSSVEKQIKK